MRIWLLAQFAEFLCRSYEANDFFTGVFWRERLNGEDFNEFPSYRFAIAILVALVLLRCDCLLDGLFIFSVVPLNLNIRFSGAYPGDETPINDGGEILRHLKLSNQLG